MTNAVGNFYFPVLWQRSDWRIIWTKGEIWYTVMAYTWLYTWCEILLENKGGNGKVSLKLATDTEEKEDR